MLLSKNRYDIALNKAPRINYDPKNPASTKSLPKYSFMIPVLSATSPENHTIEITGRELDPKLLKKIEKLIHDHFMDKYLEKAG